MKGLGPGIIKSRLLKNLKKIIKKEKGQDNSSNKNGNIPILKTNHI